MPEINIHDLNDSPRLIADPPASPNRCRDLDAIRVTFIFVYAHQPASVHLHADVAIKSD